MRILIKRIANRADYTIGHLYINKKYVCDTLEPKDRMLTTEMSKARIRHAKIDGPTAIPEGEYKVLITKSPRFGKWLPLVCGVPGFDGIRIHAGNLPKDTEGCILPGENKRVGQVLNSRYYVKLIMEQMEKAFDRKQNVTLKVESRKKRA